MTSKRLAFETMAREKLLRGIDILAAAVKVTLGPRGRHVVLERKNGYPQVTKDGVTVAREIELGDRFENMGVCLLKEVASRTSEKAGDGTTTATVLAQVIAHLGIKNVTSGANPMSLRRGIDKAVSVIINEIRRQSRPVTGRKEIAQIAAISANNDHTIGKMIAAAMEKVGRDGVITVEEARGIETTMEIVEGMRFDRGFCSSYFITDSERRECLLEEPLILIHDKKITVMKNLRPLLEEIVKMGRSLLIIAEDVEGEALAALVINRVRGMLKVAAVKAPGLGDNRKELLEDIAVLTGGVVISAESGNAIENTTIDSMGTAKKVIIDEGRTILIDGAGAISEIRKRITRIRRAIDDAASDYDREKLRERLASLLGGVAVLGIGAATESEMKEKKARVEDALHATRAAIEEGIVAGGGVTLMRAAQVLAGLKVDDEDEATGVKIVARAVEEPLRIIAANAGQEPSVICSRVREKSGDYGFNAQTLHFEDLFEAGVIDPVRVIRIALESAASIAGLVLTTECVVVESREREDTPEESDSGSFPATAY